MAPCNTPCCHLYPTSPLPDSDHTKVIHQYSRQPGRAYLFSTSICNAMNITLNGQQHHLQAATISDLLSGLNLHPEAVVVEINTEIIERNLYGSRRINDGDRIEIIRFVGGG